jgi:hypothetical protein
MKKHPPASKRLEARAARGSRPKFEAALAKVADIPPDVNDEGDIGSGDEISLLERDTEAITIAEAATG